MERVELCSVDGDYQRVAAIIDSRVIGIEKPDPRPFLLALKALGESPARAVHVGDSLHSDVVGAMGVGMRAIHIDPLNLCDENGHDHATTFEAFVEELIQSD
jgi:putative hydrolase of the HAD superfamily